MKPSVALSVLIGSFSLAAQAATLNEPCDLATVTPAAYETISCKASSTNTPYTLSADVAWGSQTLTVSQGDMIFDFTEGNHTLGVKSLSIDSATSSYVEFKGGAWDGLDVNVYGQLKFNTEANPCSDRTVVLDNTSISNIRRVHLLRGRNGTLLLRNGASLTATEFWPFDDINDETFTNNLIHVMGGSTLGLVKAIDCSWENSGSGTAALMNNRLLVEGAGSTFIGCKPYNTFRFGRYTSGNEILVRDGGKIEWYNAEIGGSETAKSNTVTVLGAGSLIEGGGHLKIGMAVGADYNRVIVADGADLKTQTYNGTVVGDTGSFNELIISNATLSRTYWVTAGSKPGASNNVVRIYGNSNVPPFGSYHYFFGAGQHNLFSFEHGTFYPSTYYYASMSSRKLNGGTWEGGASTNNQFQVVDGADLRLYDVKVQVWDATNTIYVGADSMLTVLHDLHVRGSGNRVVVSNGVLKCSQSFPGLCLGTRDSDETDGFVEGGNMLILQGSHPVVRQLDANASTVHICDHGILRFEVPPSGYQMFEQDGGSPTNAPIFQGTPVFAYGNLTLEITGVEELARSLQQPVDYVLMQNGIALISPEEGASIEKILEAANAMLPWGSTVYRSSNQVRLSVKPLRGMMLIVR